MIQRVRAERRAAGGELVLTLDAGDWYSGTLFSALGPATSSRSAPELEYFAAADYDAVALGNHDFDAGADGLARMLGKQAQTPPVLCANMIDLEGRLPQVLPWIVKELPLPFGAPALRVGIFSLMGADAAFASRVNRAAGVSFTGYDDESDAREPAAMHARAREVVSELRGAQLCDVVICLLHGGSDMGGREDDELAAAVPGIDAIVAGHTHERYLRTLLRRTTATHVWQCGSEGAALGVMEFQLTATRGLALRDDVVEGGRSGDVDGTTVAQRGAIWREGDDTHCVAVDEAAATASNGTMAQRVDAWRAEAGAVLGLDTDALVYNGTAGILLGKDMARRDISIALAGAVRDQANTELRGGGAANVSALLGAARDAGGTPLQLSAYISCVDCVRAEVHEVGGRVPLLVSDVVRAMGITGARPLSLFYLAKSDLRRACDLVDLLYHFVSPLFGITVSPNVRYTLGWGVPMFNRVKDFSIDGVGYDELPEHVLVGSNGYIAPFFWRSAELSRGAIGSLPVDARGERIAASDVPSTLATGLPVEYELLMRFLRRQPAAQ